MAENNLVSKLISWEGHQVRLTWYPGNNLEDFKPFNQVYAVCFNDEGKILIQSLPGQSWSLAGGTVETGESAEETLRREVVEEADVTIKNLILLGGHRVQYVDGDNPNKAKGNDFFQLRYYCEVDEVLPQTPDPDNGHFHERKFVSPEEINDYLNWGTIGQAIFDQATLLYRKLHPKHD